MTVKGSKQYKTRVIAYRPVRRAVFMALGTLAICGLAALCLRIGYEEAQRFHEMALTEWDELKALTEEQTQQIEQLNQQLASNSVGASVDKQALESLRREIIQQNEKIAMLQEKNDFYRKLMEPRSALKGLAVGSFTLTPTPQQGGEYHYQLVIQQFAKDPRLLKGRVNVSFVGKIAGEAKTYPLKDLSKQVEQIDIPIKFRFYQSIEGDLVLPEDFELARIDVLAEKTGSTTPVVRSFDWRHNADQAH